MYIAEISLENFRNLDGQTVAFLPGLTVIVGKNGHGKTGLLEAIYLLSQPRSFRGARPRELPRWGDGESPGAGRCRVAASVETNRGLIEVAFEVEAGDRSASINGKPVSSLGSFLGRVTTVEFTPDELSLLKGPPGNRRQFLDRTLAMIEPGYIEQLVSYNRAVKSRNKVLATVAAKSGTAAELLGPWDQALVDYGSQVLRARQRLASALAGPFRQAHRELAGAGLAGGGRAGAQGEEVTLQYRSQFLSGETIRQPDDLRAQLEIYRERDLRTKTTNFGVHHDDLLVRLKNETIVQQDCSGESDGHQVVHGGASQGQIRSAALSLKLAAAGHIKTSTGDSPILLLDDVESELDETRRENLFALVLALGHQVFVTTTDLGRSFAGRFPGAQILKMEQGRIG